MIPADDYDPWIWRLDEVGAAKDRQLARFYAALTPWDRQLFGEHGIDLHGDLRPLGPGVEDFSRYMGVAAFRTI